MSLPRDRQVADPSAAYLIADMLSDNDARTLAFGARSPLRFDFPVACKTGTSSDFRDNWAFGYTPEFTVGVWVGNFDGSPMQHVSGATGAAPLLHEIFEHLHQRFGTSWYLQPSDVVECLVHPLTGKRLNGGQTQVDATAIREKFLAGHLPAPERDEDYVPTPAVAPIGRNTAGASQDPTINPVGRVRTVRLGNEYRDWLAGADNYLGQRVALTPGPEPLHILFPPPGTTVYLDPDLPQRGSRLLLRAAGPADVQWHSDSLELTDEGGRVVALLKPGHHELRVRDPQTGAQARTWFDVLAR